MKRILTFVLALSALVSCTDGSGLYANRAEAIAAQIHDPQSRYVVVTCHRGDWRNFPENSIPAIESIIRMGADIMELDLKMPADQNISYGTVRTRIIEYAEANNLPHPEGKRRVKGNKQL